MNFNIQNSEVQDFAKTISKIMNRKFIIDPGTRGRITIINPAIVTQDDNYVTMSARNSQRY